MRKAKRALAAMVMTLAVFEASASGYEMWNGGAWVRNGTFLLSGPTVLVVSNIQIPCNADFVVQISNGVATVIGADFSGTMACVNIDASTPWSISPPVAAGINVNLTITTYLSAMGNSCHLPVSGTLTYANPNPMSSPNELAFSGQYFQCKFSTDSGTWPYKLSTMSRIRAYFP